MLSIFSSNNKDEAIKPAVAPAAAKTAVPTAAAQPDMKTAYLGKNELTATRLKELADVAEGCALMMGFVKPVVKAHGASDAKAFESAMNLAFEMVEVNVVEKMKVGLDESGIR